MKTQFRRILALLLLIVSICTFGSSIALAEGTDSSQDEIQASEKPQYDFKKFMWGDSETDIADVEGEPVSTGQMKGLDAHYIVYEASVAGKDALLVYYFCDKGLYEVRYILTERHSNDRLYIDDYNDVKRALTKKYGDPLIDEETWQDERKKDYYKDKKSDALSYGYLSYWTCFLNDRIEVNMDMSADNYDIKTVIYFSSLTISPGEEDFSDDF